MSNFQNKFLNYDVPKYMQTRAFENYVCTRTGHKLSCIGFSQFFSGYFKCAQLIWVSVRDLNLLDSFVSNGVWIDLWEDFCFLQLSFSDCAISKKIKSFIAVGWW